MINAKLLSAYRFRRHHAVGDVYPRRGPNPAYEALQRARADVANGKERYPAATGYGPAYEARGSKHMRWIEKPSTCGLRFVGYAADIAGLRHNGWYVDNDQNETVRGVVFRLPARHGKPQFIGGYEDWNNGKADSNGPVSLDFADIFDDEKDAARAADQIAEWLAASEREYQAAWQAGSRYHDLGETIVDGRKAALQLLEERRAAARSGKGESFGAICAAIRDKVDSILETIAEARQERRKLISGDYISDWLPGFSTRDNDLCAAFNDGAGETIIPV